MGDFGVCVWLIAWWGAREVLGLVGERAPSRSALSPPTWRLESYKSKPVSFNTNCWSCTKVTCRWAPFAQLQMDFAVQISHKLSLLFIQTDINQFSHHRNENFFLLKTILTWALFLGLTVLERLCCCLSLKGGMALNGPEWHRPASLCAHPSP